MFEKTTPYLWLAAFLCSLYFINDWQLELFAAGVAIISLWAVTTLGVQSQQGFTVPQSLCLRIVVAFWALTFFSILGSDVVNVSVMAFCFFSVLPLTFLVMSTNYDQKILWLIGKALAAIFCGLAVWALIQFFVFNELFQGRARHPLKNPNSLGALFSLMSFCGFGAMLYFKDATHKKCASAFGLLMLGGLIATGSRGALFALIPVFIVFLFVAKDIVQENKKFVRVFIVLALGVFASSTLGEAISQNLSFRFMQTITMQSPDITNNRISLWLASWEIIKQHGIFGTGIGTYFLYFPEFRLPTDRTGAYYAHNDPLQFWVELGVLGPILFYTFILAVTLRTVKALKTAVSQHDKLMILTPFFAVAACVLHTHVTFNFYNLSILFLVGFLLSVWFVATQKVLKTRVKIYKFPENYSRASRTVLILIPFIFIVGLFGAYVISETYTNKARDHLLKAELPEFADDVLMANKISLQGNYRSYLLAVNVPLTLLQDNADKFDDDQKREIFDQGLAYLRHILNINPRSASAHYYLGKIQQLVPDDFVPDDLKSPQDYYERALKLDPIHIGARIELSYIYEQNLLSFDRALKLIDTGTNYRYTTSKVIDLYGRLAELHLKAGNIEGQQDAIQRMIKLKQRFDKAIAKKERGLDLF